MLRIQYIAFAAHVPDPASPIEATSMERVRRIHTAEHAVTFLQWLHRMEGTSPVTPQPDNSHLASGIEELSSVAAGFYEALMCEKPCDMNAARPMLETLSSNPIPKKAAASIEGAITEKEVRTSIRSMAKGKACGPDGLHAEFYRTHENLLLDFLTHTFNEMHAEGSLTDSMRRDNIILLYKQKGPLRYT